MAAAINNVVKECVPYGEKRIVFITCEASSGDTIDTTSSTVMGSDTFSSIDYVSCYDKTWGDIVTADASAGTTITIDASGGTTSHNYSLIIVGE
ncbi:MAG: hypothetical protein ACTSXD_06825 [Candidatus Heimdallarchaeaceae archaeon]